MANKTKKAAREKHRVTATIFLPGDRSVGIPDGYIRLDFGEWYGTMEQVYSRFLDVYKGGREEHRVGLKEWADKFHEECGGCSVLYGDEECPGMDD